MADSLRQDDFCLPTALNYRVAQLFWQRLSSSRILAPRGNKVFGRTHRQATPNQSFGLCLLTILSMVPSSLLVLRLPHLSGAMPQPALGNSKFVFADDSASIQVETSGQRMQIGHYRSGMRKQYERVA